jgi:hypothetical protein
VDFDRAAVRDAPAAMLRLPKAVFLLLVGASAAASLLRAAIARLAPVFGLDLGVTFFAI